VTTFMGLMVLRFVFPLTVSYRPRDYTDLIIDNSFSIAYNE
jgi:hypothetical protein